MQSTKILISTCLTVCILTQFVSSEGEGCNLGNVSEPCDSAAVRFYHDPLDCVCKQLAPGQCQANSFATWQECATGCGATKCPVCNLPKRHGNCTDYTKKFYFNVHTCTCVTFNYGGCDGNGNRFDTAEECENTCGGFQCPVCNLPADKGTCKGILAKWYFDDEACTCKEFDYGGCEGNNNRFYSQQDCEKSCTGSVCRRAACTQEVKPGPCKAVGTRSRYFFNGKTERCEKFNWGGCAPNSNNYVAKRYCRQKCMTKTPLPDENFAPWG